MPSHRAPGPLSDPPILFVFQSLRAESRTDEAAALVDALFADGSLVADGAYIRIGDDCPPWEADYMAHLVQLLNAVPSARVFCDSYLVQS